VSVRSVHAGTEHAGAHVATHLTARLAVAALAGLFLVACERSGDDLAAAARPESTTAAADPLESSSGSAGGATASTVAESSAAGSTVPPTESPNGSSPSPPVSIVDVPEVGVPGLDSTDAFCSSWSRFGGSFQVVAVAAAFGSGPPEQLAALEIAASPTVTAAYADLLANWPAELASEFEIVADDFLGPFARRLEAAYDSLIGVGADAATVTAIGDAWLAGLARRDPSTPEFVVDLPDDVWATIDEAAEVFGDRLVPFGSDPSLVTDVSTPLTSEYLGASCPDQGTLTGQEVESP
jgi:hypothetical protein